MSLRTPDTQLGSNNSSGVLTTGYRVEFAAELDPSTFSEVDNGPWTQVEAKLETVDFGYGPSDKLAQFTMWDAGSVAAPYLVSPLREQVMPTPQNGTRVRIWHWDQTINDYRLIFKGSIKLVHQVVAAEGTAYRVQAFSELCRLNESFVFFTANYKNDFSNPSPVFNASTGFLVQTTQFTVQQLINLVMTFPDAYNTPQYFTPSMINWNGLDTDPRCGQFVPSHVSLPLDNASKGKAIEEILSLAGNFTFMYVPGDPSAAKASNPFSPPPSDQIVIVERNLSCSNCGPKWNIPFANTSSIAQQSDSPQYATDFSIISDETEWTMKDTANVCRMISGPVRWYSGHWFIPTCTDPTATDPHADTRNLVLEPGDTLPEMKQRSLSLDNTYYRAFTPNGRNVDNRALQRSVVGLPMFPDWNIHDDYTPALVRLNLVRFNDPAHISSGITAMSYQGLVEWQTNTVGDLCSHGGNLIGRVDHLRSYQAWHCPNDCPACNGTGLVKAVYNNAANEPAFDFWAVGPSGVQRQLTGNNYTVTTTEVIEARVNNYIFNPNDFGNTNPTTGMPIPPTGLIPFDPTNAADPVVVVTGGYPLPWKNLCPYCRGVGKQPLYKIRDIQSELFLGRNNQAVTDPGNPDFSNPSETPMDFDATSTHPETWEETQGRIMFSEGASIVVEAPVLHELPNYLSRNKAWPDLYASGGALPQNFPHPLQYKNTFKLMAGRYTITGDAANIVPPTWTVSAPYSTVNNATRGGYHIDLRMGRVIFDEPQFIPRKGPTQVFDYDTSTRQHIINNDGTLKVTSKVQISGDESYWPGFWRPARVWMQFFYTREHYYNAGQVNPSNTPVSTVTVSHTDPDGNTFNYNFRSMIIDGKWAVEAQRQSGGYGTLRVIQKADGDESVPIEVTEEDFWAMPVPPTIDATEAALEAIKVANGQVFTRGKMLKTISQTPGEIIRQQDGVTNQDITNSTERPIVYSWRMRDGRTRLMQLAVRELELHDNLTVGGSITLCGVSTTMNTGLGYVDYPNNGLAAVVSASYNYINGFESSINLSRERSRVGLLPPKAEQLLNSVVKDIGVLRREGSNPPQATSGTIAVVGYKRPTDTQNTGGGGPKIIFFPN